MDTSDVQLDPNELPAPREPWQGLLAPLPDGAAPERRAIAPEVAAKPEGKAIAGWKEIVLHLSAGVAGGRSLLVVLDQLDRLTAASDHVVYRVERKTAEGREIAYHHRSIGGRFTEEGAFQGTCWHTLNRETADGVELENDSTPSEPTDTEVSTLRALVSELIRRAVTNH